MAKKRLNFFDGYQNPTDVVGFDKDKIHFDYLLRKRENSEDNQTEEPDNYVSRPKDEIETEDNQTVTNNINNQLQNKKSTTKRKTFSQAFASARREGKKTFWFNGKQFTTQLKGEDNKSNKPVSNTTSKRNNINTNTNKSSVNKQKKQRFN